MLPRLALAGGAWLSGGGREAGLGGRDGEEFGQIAVRPAGIIRPAQAVQPAQTTHPTCPARQACQTQTAPPARPGRIPPPAAPPRRPPARQGRSGPATATLPRRLVPASCPDPSAATGLLSSTGTLHPLSADVRRPARKALQLGHPRRQHHQPHHHRLHQPGFAGRIMGIERPGLRESRTAGGQDPGKARPGGQDSDRAGIGEGRRDGSQVAGDGQSGRGRSRRGAA